MCAGAARPSMTSAIAAAASSLVRSSCRISFSISCGNIVSVRLPFQEIPQKAAPSPVRIDSGWNCTPCTGHVRWRRPMIVAVLARPRADLELVRQPLLRDDERVIARGDERLGQPLEHAAAVVLDRRRLAVHRRGGADDRAAEHRADRLMPEADAEDRAFWPKRRITLIVTPAFSGRPGPGEITM